MKFKVGDVVIPNENFLGPLLVVGQLYLIRIVDEGGYVRVTHDGRIVRNDDENEKGRCYAPDRFHPATARDIAIHKLQAAASE